MLNSLEAAKAIRGELKAEFPGIKFRVRKTKDSNVWVGWVGGPNKDDVKGVVFKYKCGQFDGMVDVYEYSNRCKDLPQVHYITLQRQD